MYTQSQKYDLRRGQFLRYLCFNWVRLHDPETFKAIETAVNEKYPRPREPWYQDPGNLVRRVLEEIKNRRGG